MVQLEELSNILIFHSITINFVSDDETISALTEIAVFIRWEWKDLKCKDRRSCENVTRAKMRKKPFFLILGNPKSWKAFTRNQRDVCGVLVVNDYVGCEVYAMINLVISKDYHISAKATGHTLAVPNHPGSKEKLPESFSTPNNLLDDYPEIKERLRKKISFYIRHKQTLKEKILAGD